MNIVAGGKKIENLGGPGGSGPGEKAVMGEGGPGEGGLGEGEVLGRGSVVGSRTTHHQLHHKWQRPASVSYHTWHSAHTKNRGQKHFSASNSFAGG